MINQQFAGITFEDVIRLLFSLTQRGWKLHHGHHQGPCMVDPLNRKVTLAGALYFAVTNHDIAERTARGRNQYDVLVKEGGLSSNLYNKLLYAGDHPFYPPAQTIIHEVGQKIAA